MRVSIAVADGLTDSGLAIALDVLRASNSICRARSRRPPFAVTVCSHDGRPVRTAARLRLGGLSSFTVAARADVLLVPGTWVEDDAAVDRWMAGPDFGRLAALARRAHRRGARVFGSCTGTFVLGAAGVLDGGPATTSWWLARSFVRAWPSVNLDPTRALCARPEVATAGAVFAMADLALHVVRTTVGPEVASLAARYLLLDEHPGQAPYMALQQLAADDELLTRAEAWMRRHLREPFGLAALARGVGASTRTLARRVQSSLATTPARWVRRVRAEEARRLLETSRLPIERIAEEVGFGSALSMRRTVVALYGLTPRELRRSVLGRAARSGRERRRAAG